MHYKQMQDLSDSRNNYNTSTLRNQENVRNVQGGAGLDNQQSSGDNLVQIPQGINKIMMTTEGHEFVENFSTGTDHL